MNQTISELDLPADEPRCVVHSSQDNASAKHRIGNWQLIGSLGRGQWTCVYRARPAVASQQQSASYAVKVLRRERQDDPLAQEMLAREARVAAQVQHPHLIAILEAQLAHEPQHLVMPWLEGASLEAYTRARRLLDPPAVLWIARQTAEALEALDRAGWRHGDIKPSNIFISPRGHATLLDLGFARHRGEKLPGAGMLAGSGHYLAPEQAFSTARPDIRSDIYSLGVVLYQLLSGRLPLDGETLSQLVAAHKRTAPPHLRRIAPHVPPRAADLVQRMLAKDPLRRPQSPGELRAELVRLEIDSFSERAA
jgi:eukaryotic-like serine/threonine-protein kinase